MKIKQLILLRGCLLLLIVTGTMVTSHEIKADPITITSAVLIGSPEIPCDGSSPFRLLLRGTAPANTTFMLTYGVFGVNPGDILERQLNPSNTIDLMVDSNGEWSSDIVFLLRCVGCDFVQGFNPVRVDSGSDIFARIIVPGNVARDTNVIDVSCVTPEPTTIFLFGTGLAGIAIKTWKKLKRRKSG